VGWDEPKENIRKRQTEPLSYQPRRRSRKGEREFMGRPSTISWAAGGEITIKAACEMPKLYYLCGSMRRGKVFGGKPFCFSSRAPEINGH
jgi:hypothetical protein